MTELLSATDEQLARRAQRGCAKSFELLVRRFQVPLLHFLRKRVKSLADAEDLLQETFVRAYQQIGRYRDRWRFSTWIFTIAHRSSVSHHRKRQAESNRIGGASREPAVSLPSPDHRIVEEESRRRFWDLAADVLSDDQFCAVWLYYVEEMPTRDITRVLNCSWVSVKTTLYRARRRLAPHLGSWREEPTEVPIGRKLIAARS
jgi:RNA polymerase sigma-70 factor (ECF subfamily)